jgi:hypothetical protein
MCGENVGSVNTKEGGACSRLGKGCCGMNVPVTVPEISVTQTEGYTRVLLSS